MVQGFFDNFRLNLFGGVFFHIIAISILLYVPIGIQHIFRDLKLFFKGVRFGIWSTTFQANFMNFDLYLSIFDFMVEPIE